MNRRSPCVADFRYNFRVELDFVSKLDNTFRAVHDVENCFTNVRNALFSGTNFVQPPEIKSDLDFIWKLLV